MILDRNSREGQALIMLRFPLACLIVLLHTGVTCGPENLAYYLPNYLMPPIVGVAVPAFFFMSGYLFFMGKEDFNLTIYKEQMKKKIDSLLIPYLLWNMIAYVLKVFYSYAKMRTIGDVMPWELDKIFWSNGGGIMTTSVFGYEFPAIVSPAAGVLWFLRDLIMMMVCSILIYQIIRKVKWWIFPILFVINALKIGIPFPGFSLPAITYFSMGAFFSIHEINVFTWLRNKIVYWVWPVLIVIQIVLKSIQIGLGAWFALICLTVGIAFFFKWAYDAAMKTDGFHQRIKQWGETSFFIYTFANTQIVWFINKEPGYLLDAIPTIGPLLNYLFLFSTPIIECLIVFYLMKRYCINILYILVGGRIRKT